MNSMLITIQSIYNPMCINGQVLIYSVRMPWWWPNGDNPYKHQNIANLQFSFDKVTEQNIENEKFQRFGANNFLWHKHCRDHRKICRNAGTPIMTWSRLAAMYTFKLKSPKCPRKRSLVLIVVLHNQAWLWWSSRRCRGCWGQGHGGCSWRGWLHILHWWSWGHSSETPGKWKYCKWS